MTTSDKNLLENIFVFNHETRTNKPNILRKYLPVPLYKGKVELLNINRLEDLLSLVSITTVKIKSNLSLNLNKDLFILDKEEINKLNYGYFHSSNNTKTVEYIDLCFFDQNDEPINLPPDFYISMRHTQNSIKNPIFYVTDEEYNDYL